jgi:arylsulfatase
MAIRYPKAISAKGEIRNQFYHVIDVAPTILDLLKIPQPKVVNGFKQKPMDGVSMAVTFNNPKAPDNRTTQYFNIFGNRGIYHKGWMASTLHNIPWIFDAKYKPVTEDKWELYNLNDDFSQAVDLAASNPKKLEELKAVFNTEAIKYKVYPIDDRKAPRTVPSVAGRPDILNGRKEMSFYPGMKGLPEQGIISVKNVEFTVTADVILNSNSENGVIVAQGGRFAGWAFFLKDGKPVYEHNFFGLDRYQAASTDKLAAGKHQIVLHFTPDDPQKPGSPGNAVITVDGKKYAEGRTKKMVYGMFSSDEGLDIGLDEATPVSLDYKEGDNKFTGKINKVTISVK